MILRSLIDNQKKIIVRCHIMIIRRFVNASKRCLDAPWSEKNFLQISFDYQFVDIGRRCKVFEYLTFVKKFSLKRPPYKDIHNAS